MSAKKKQAQKQKAQAKKNRKSSRNQRQRKRRSRSCATERKPEKVAAVVPEKKPEKVVAVVPEKKPEKVVAVVPEKKAEKVVAVVPEKKAEKVVAVVPEKKAEKVAQVTEKGYFLAVRLLGPFGAPYDIDSALVSLKLKHKFHAVLLEKNGSMLGILRKVKDYVTWGEVRAHDIAALLKERGELSNGMAFNNKFVKENLGHESIEELAMAIARRTGSLKIDVGEGSHAGL